MRSYLLTIGLAAASCSHPAPNELQKRVDLACNQTATILSVLAEDGDPRELRDALSFSKPMLSLCIDGWDSMEPSVANVEAIVSAIRDRHP